MDGKEEVEKPDRKGRPIFRKGKAEPQGTKRLENMRLHQKEGQRAGAPPKDSRRGQEGEKWRPKKKGELWGKINPPASGAPQNRMKRKKPREAKLKEKKGTVKHHSKK